MEKKYQRTDLACEANVDLAHIEGTEYSVEDKDICIIERLDILTDGAAEHLGKEMGSYVTVSTPRIQYLGDNEINELSEIIGKEIKGILLKTTGREKITPDFSVMVAGLGNRDITADAVGPLTADNITVTRHLSSQSPSLFDLLGLCSVSAISPSVLGKTGIESAETIKYTVASTKPHALIIIDALAARSTERLARTFQISDTGITPGAGIGNNRETLSKNTLGIPVVSIGIPTVVDTATLVFDALISAGISSVTENIDALLQASENLFVTPKDTDEIIKKAVRLLSASIDLALVIS